jgi:hypothetical protein
MLAGRGLDRGGEVGVGRQPTVGVPVGAQDVRQDHRVTRVGFPAGLAIALAVAGHGPWVNREHHEPGSPQRRHEQPFVAFDRDLDCGRLGRMFGQQLDQLAEAGDVVADPCPGHHRAVVVHDRHVVVALGPVDAARVRQVRSSKSDGIEPRICAAPSWQRSGARHLTSRLQTQQLAEATVYLEAWSGR